MKTKVYPRNASHQLSNLVAQLLKEKSELGGFEFQIKMDLLVSWKIISEISKVNLTDLKHQKMQYKASSPEVYIAQIPEERKAIMAQLRSTIKQNLPDGFEEGINYDMIGFYVPHSAYPNGYHCDTSLPLPFINIASQKNSINLYHSGMYAKQELYDWFVNEYPKYSKRKLDMGKSCIRFKKVAEIPFKLIAELCTKMTMEEWISIYESNIKK